jgi:hypothetical protein
MVFSDFKGSIKACGSESLIIKDSFSYLTFFSSLLEFLEILLNLRKSLRSSLSEFFSDNIEEFMVKKSTKIWITLKKLIQTRVYPL